jgi:hypothetical protein
VARVAPTEMPEGRIQLLTHHTEDAVWQPRWLAHPNGALGLTSVMIVVANIGEAAHRFVRFAERAANRTRIGYEIALDRGRVDLVTPETFTQMIPQIAIPSLPFIAAYGIKVKSLAVLESLLAQSGLAALPYADGLLAPFPEQLGHGAWLFAE